MEVNTRIDPRCYPDRSVAELTDETRCRASSFAEGPGPSRKDDSSGVRPHSKFPQSLSRESVSPFCHVVHRDPGSRRCLDFMAMYAMEKTTTNFHGICLAQSIPLDNSPRHFVYIY
jgi:hypothetical protein